MIVIPAVDIKDGKCVRLRHGRSDDQTTYADNPLEAAKRWTAGGARRLHVIDLDGAFEGKPRNLDWAVRIKNETGAVVQMGGGLRSEEAVKAVLDAGIDKVILGTILFTEPPLAQRLFAAYPDRIMVALDVKDGRVAIRGWTDSTAVSLGEALETVTSLGGREIIFTDIGRDGTLSGANIDAVKLAMAMTPLAIYASGGVSSIEDIRALRSARCPGCIVGKSLYEGRLDLAEAIQAAGDAG